MTILFTRSWDVIHGKFDEYSEFMTNQYNPTLEKLGINLARRIITLRWAKGQGSWLLPQSRNRITCAKSLPQNEYRIISGKLMNLVSAYSSKLWVSTGRLLEEPYRIHTGAWKFNQVPTMWFRDRKKSIIASSKKNAFQE